MNRILQMSTEKLGYSPARLIEGSCKQGFKYKISYGGGMGGASMSYYSYEQEDISLPIVHINSIEHKAFITVNSRFIVSREPVLIVTRVLDLTQNSNWNCFRREQWAFPLTEFKDVEFGPSFKDDMNSYRAYNIVSNNFDTVTGAMLNEKI